MRRSSRSRKPRRREEDDSDDEWYGYQRGSHVDSECAVCGKAVLGRESAVLLCDGTTWGLGRWRNCIIIAIYDNDTYDIDYDDGLGVQHNVPASYIARSLVHHEKAIERKQSVEKRGKSLHISSLHFISSTNKSNDSVIMPTVYILLAMIVASRPTYRLGERVISNFKRCANEVHIECLRYPEVFDVPKEDFYCPVCVPPKEAETAGIQVPSSRLYKKIFS